VGRDPGAPGNGYLHTIRHWDGHAWGLAYEEPGETLWAVWGLDARHVWAVGDGRILHWDGQSWTGTDSPSGCGDGMNVWGPSASDLWVVGYGIARWDGAAWRCTTAPKEAHGALRAVFGRGPDDVWIASDGADLSHWDGAAWTTFPVELASVRRFWGPP
jgi:hypothetical protein